MLDRSRAIENGIDYDQGLKRFLGKSEIYEKYLGKFIEDTNYQDMLVALDKNDIESVFRHAHALKGLAGNLSMNKLYDNIVNLVEELKIGETEKVVQLVASMKENYKKLIEVL